MSMTSTTTLHPASQVRSLRQTAAAQSGKAASTITVTPVNDPPTSLSLSASLVNENETDATIGVMTVTDPDSGDSHSFILSDNRFVVVASQLQLKPDQTLDFEAESSIILHITARDAGGLEITKSFSIIVADVNDAPISIQVSTATIREHISGETIGFLSALDQDAGQSHIFSILADPRFEVVGAALKLKADQFLDRSDGATVSVDVSTTDNGTPPLTFHQILLLNVATTSHPWHNPIESLDTCIATITSPDWRQLEPPVLRDGAAGAEAAQSVACSVGLL